MSLHSILCPRCSHSIDVHLVSSYCDGCIGSDDWGAVCSLTPADIAVTMLGIERGVA